MVCVPLVRAAHLKPYLGLLREIGMPVERALARAGLPSELEERPDARVSVHLALGFASAGRSEATIGELGFLAAQRAGFGIFGTRFRTVLLDCVSGRARIEALPSVVDEEDSAVRLGLEREGAALSVRADMPSFREHPGLPFAEWLNVQALVLIVRSVAGPGWSPEEITLVSATACPARAAEAYPDTRILTGMRHSSILVPADVLSRQCQPPPRRGSGSRDAAKAAACRADGFVADLRSAIRPYLGETHPSIGLAAEMAGLTVRTLQRELARHGRSYSDIVKEARYEIACALLGDPDVRIIEIAYAAGYENPQHFSRAFRQIAGVSPRAWRTARLATA